MPVTVRKGSGERPWKIVEIASGKIVGASKTENKAKSAARVRNAVLHGLKPKR